MLEAVMKVFYDDEINAFLQQQMEQRNSTPLADFHGLSSEQTHRFLHFPFATPYLVTFPSRLESDPQARSCRCSSCWQIRDIPPSICACSGSSSGNTTGPMATIRKKLPLLDQVVQFHL